MILSIDAEARSRTSLLRRSILDDVPHDRLAVELGVSTRELDVLLRARGLARLLVQCPTRFRASDRQVQRYEAGALLDEIAFELEARQDVTAQALMRAGAALRPGDLLRLQRPPTGIPRSVLERQLVQERRSTAWIATQHGLSRQRVYQLLRRYGLPTVVERDFDPATVLKRRTLDRWLRKEHLSVRDVAERNGLKPRHVYELMRRWNIHRPPKHVVLGVDERTLRQLYLREGLSIASVAATLNVSTNAIRSAMRHYQIPARPKDSATSRGMATILTPNYLVERIHRGDTIAAIARDLKVSPTTVQKYVARAGLSAARPRP